ncbi:START domain-containing protein 10-like [Lacerta agilis]|uniref:START domain-containing protein 10-like n=1 Tax=Lacerta agilis TaxID=80427 RepID=UPI00141975B1|nr:START domain-containing protein 10-like [Lacerta agilis]XP_032993494.1 START domain-containing protein 10-like [Lacerta agilis]
MEPVTLPNDAAFRDFLAECESQQGWLSWYDRSGISVWEQVVPHADLAVYRIKGSIDMAGVTAETAYDVLHDTEYRSMWDINLVETHEIARLTDNADVSYYAWKCPKPLRNRDVVTLRSWSVLDKAYIILNFSVKHPKYPPRKGTVRAASRLAGYLVQPTGHDSCRMTYLAQLDPKGFLPKWIVNKAAQFLAPKLMRKLYKACLAYPSWKQEHSMDVKPWLHPEQNQLPTMLLSELALQHASSLENIDESSVAEAKDQQGEASGSD